MCERGGTRSVNALAGSTVPQAPFDQSLYEVFRVLPRPDNAHLKSSNDDSTIVPERVLSSGIFARARYFYYLPIAFLRMIVFSLARQRIRSGDIAVLRFILLTPWFYIVGFKGSLNTPFGKTAIENRDKIRSVAYGVFKTHFSYLKEISAVIPSKSHFSTVVDVGANIGDFTMALARSSEKIVAVEPGVRNFLALESNIAANRIENVLTLNVAAHDRNEVVRLVGIDSMLRIVDSESGQIAKGVLLDETFCDLNLGFIDLLKLDVQGHEERVLKGMSETLKKKNVGLVVVEAHPVRGVSPTKLAATMESYGYRLVQQTEYIFGQPHLYFLPNGHSANMCSIGHQNLPS